MTTISLLIDNISSVTVRDVFSTQEALASYSDRVVSAIWVYFSPFIFFVGIVGNTLNICVLRRKRFTGSTVSLYLPLIATADNFVLITGIIPEWLQYMGIVIFGDISPWTCKFEKFFFYTFGDIAIWLLTAFTFDRFCAVCFPMKRHVMCSHHRVLIGCGSLALAAVLKNIMVFWTRGTQYIDVNGQTIVDNCGYPSSTAEYISKYVRPWIAFALVNALPFVLIITFNIVIVRVLVKRKDLTASPKQGDSQGRRPQTSIMCISVSVLFLVTITPSMVLLIGKPYWDNNSDSYRISKAVANVMVYLNHSLNFFMYCMSGARFRTELVAMFTRTPEDETRRRSLANGGHNIHNTHSVPMQTLCTLEVNHLQVDSLSNYGSMSRSHSTCSGYVNGAIALEDETTRV